MRSLIRIAFGLAAVLPLAAHATPVNLSTGVATYTWFYDPSTPPQAPSYAGPSTMNGTAFSVSPNPSWGATVPAGTSWISTTVRAASTMSSAGAGYYTYITPFNSPSTFGTFVGEFASDNKVIEVLLDGVVIAGLSSPTTTGTFNYLTSFSFDDYTLRTGALNRIDFVVDNSTQGATGLLVALTFTPAPEPGSLALMGTGLVLLAIFGLRFRNVRV